MSSKKTIVSFSKLLSGILLLALIQSDAQAYGDTSEELQTRHYRAMDGSVDADTFRGYNVYHSVCVGCHGVGGSGTETAPALTRSIDQFTPAEFQIRVLHKYVVRFSTDHWRVMEESMLKEVLKQQQRDEGNLADMPRWEYNPVVKQNVDNIYSYLRARSDGVIDEGRPGLLK